MVVTIRERLAALAAPLGITLPEEYAAFMENPPACGILAHHLCPKGDPPYEWWPATVEDLESDVHGGRGRQPLLFAHYLRAEAEEYLAGGWESVPGPDGTEFGTDRLSRGFWIGEVDGDSVFIDAQTFGVFAYLMHEQTVEQWAVSFAEFVAHGQQGRT